MSFDEQLKKPGFTHSGGEHVKLQPSYEGLPCGTSSKCVGKTRVDGQSQGRAFSCLYSPSGYSPSPDGAQRGTQQRLYDYFASIL